MTDTAPRRCFYIDVTSQTPHGFIPSMVTENVPGHSLMSGNGDFAQPWYWGNTYEEARAVAATENARLGLDEDAVRQILLSSMGAARSAEDSTDDVEHDDNDDCANYVPGYQVKVRGVAGTINVEDLESGGMYRDPASDPADIWYYVDDVERVTDDEVHVAYTGLCERCQAERITDTDCGLGDNCVGYNAGRVNV
jgi:hypothetical protein